MQSRVKCGVLIGVNVWLLSACQHTYQAFQTVNIYATPKVKTAAKIFCSGTDDCEFERINNLSIVNETTHLVNSTAIQKSYIRLKPQQTTLQANSIYMTVPSGQNEIVIRFYPISKDRAEKITVIHQFKAQKTYIFNMYRAREPHVGNLLHVSAPDPLCVDLLEEKKVVRHFCKPYNVLTGLGEFIEKKVF